MNLSKLLNSDPGGTDVRFSLADMREMGVSSLPQGKSKFRFKEILSEYRQLAKFKHRRSNPIAPGQADLVQWTLYDRVTAAQGTTLASNFTYFTIPKGSGGKTKADTNLEQVSRLPDPKWMNVVGVGFYFSSKMLKTDIDGFLDTYYMEFWVSDKVYLEGPYQCYPAAAGLTGFTTHSASSAAGILTTNGVARTDNFFDVRLPGGLQLGLDANGANIMTDGLIGITILQGQSFKVENTAPAGGLALTAVATDPLATGFNGMCYLYGILSRGVQ